MQKVTDYTLVECIEVKDYIEKGWQPWGNALVSWNGRSNAPHQPMVKYKAEDSYSDTKGPWAPQD